MSENYNPEYKGWKPKPLGGKIATGESLSPFYEPEYLKYRDTVLALMPVNTPEKAVEYRKAWKECYGEELDKYLSHAA